MPRIQIEIRPIAVQVQGPLAIGTGFRRGLIQRTVARDPEGFAYIPASALKGRTRRACEQLARQVGQLARQVELYVCHAPRPEAMCNAHGQACLVCRVFGRPGYGSELRWHDARLSNAYRQAFESSHEAQFYSRTQVQLSRAFGTAAYERLFTSEYVMENLLFDSAIEGWLDLTPVAGDPSLGYELLLLLAGMQLVNSLGGGTSRGAGCCTIRLPECIMLSGHKISVASLLENIDLLEGYAQETGNGA